MAHQERRSTSKTKGRISGKGESSRRTTNVPTAKSDTSVPQPIYPPIANVNRIMREAITNNGRISDEAKEIVQACVSEFIGHITSVANEKCHSEHRKTVTADDLIFAMGTLGFDDYVEPLSVYLEKMREADPDRNPRSRIPRGKRRAISPPPVPDQIDPSPQFQGYAGPSVDGYYVGNGAYGNVGGSSSNVQFDPSWLTFM